jgi:hypothetical protein
MGREVRRVPADWEHPKNERGNYIPLYGRSFSKEVADWDEGAAQWENGFLDNYKGGWEPKDQSMDYPYEEWSGKRPEEHEYMPDWPDEQRTHIQMYEDTSEGTPISPVMETPEELARWLADNNASAFAGMKATYEQWLSTIKHGFACSMIMQGNRIDSGVAMMAEDE